ncbi:MAG TPA: thioredoxin family protein, partial [Phycisphaerae bacterium]
MLGAVVWYGAALVGNCDGSEPKPAAPPELGDVAWRRGLELAAQAARKDGKPLLVLFDEVPGCETCKGYGRNVLTHPLLVEAIETCFVPVAVYNNIPGADEQTLKAFKEPAWNNPVVRIIDAESSEPPTPVG